MFDKYASSETSELNPKSHSQSRPQNRRFNIVFGIWIAIPILVSWIEPLRSAVLASDTFQLIQTLVPTIENRALQTVFPDKTRVVWSYIVVMSPLLMLVFLFIQDMSNYKLERSAGIVALTMLTLWGLVGHFIYVWEMAPEPSSSGIYSVIFSHSFLGMVLISGALGMIFAIGLPIGLYSVRLLFRRS